MQAHSLVWLCACICVLSDKVKSEKIENMTIYDVKEKCNGCRACEQICPNHCIHMVMDEEGFLYPEINKSQCSNCNLCKRTCRAVEAKPDADMRITYAVKNKNHDIRMKSSSGGVFYELARAVIEKGGIVFGAVFDEDFNVCHKGIESLEQVKLMMGSKYVQSDTLNTYQEVKAALKAKRSCLYSGTPCQIAGLKAYLQKEDENLICAALICHGVPSPEVWRRYLLFQKGRYGENIIKNIEFRNKSEGWRNRSLKITFENHIYKKTRIKDSDDLFMKGFGQNMYLRPSCYTCRVKGKNQQADIIIGDYWGVENYHPELDDGMGVSAVIVNSEKGMRLFFEAASHFNSIVSEYAYIQKKQLCLEGCVKLKKQRQNFYEELYATGRIDTSIENNIETKEKRYRYQYPLIMKYLENKIQGKEIYDFIADSGFKNVAIYALTEWTDMVYDDISRHTDKIQIVCVCDKAYTRFSNGFHGNEVVGIEELVRQYKQGRVDGVVVCNVFREKEIIQELVEKGICQEHVISIISVIFHAG